MSHDNIFNQIISLENLFLAWKEFKRGKRTKFDVEEFERNLEDNIFNLHFSLKNQTYRHSNYTSFYITGPKLRLIHKACVRDRIVHHAVYRVLYLIFEKSFVFDSYSCRVNKGAHKAVYRLDDFIQKVSQNYSKPCFALKCDVKKFFASIDQAILINQIKQIIKDQEVMWLIQNIILSFNSAERKRVNWKIGLPIGNLTSQLFANIYLNDLDQFIKSELKIKYFLRYCDDFIILDQDPKFLKDLLEPIQYFLKNNLNISLHPYKIEIRKLKQGIDSKNLTPKLASGSGDVKMSVYVRTYQKIP